MQKTIKFAEGVRRYASALRRSCIARCKREAATKANGKEKKT